MKEISWTDLKRKLLSDIQGGPCLKVTGNSEMVFYVIIRPEQVMKDRIEGLCSLIDTSRGLQ